MKTAMSGPLLVYGDRNPPGTGSTGSVNSDKAPSVFWGGTAILDPRVGYNVTRIGCIGWGVGNDLPVLDQVPSTLSATNICGAQAPTSGTALTLASASTGITVLSSGLVVWAAGNTVPSGALVLDSNPALVTFGIASVSTGTTTVSLYDPTTMLARNVRITTNGNDTSGTYVVAGYDVYGYATNETITGVNNAVASGKKAFKFIVSVTPGGTINSTSVTVGTGDVFGYPLYLRSFGYQDTTWVASGGSVSYATAETTPFGTASAYVYGTAAASGDVRGTIYVGTAQPSNNSKRLTILQTIAVTDITSNLTGAAQT